MRNPKPILFSAIIIGVLALTFNSSCQKKDTTDPRDTFIGSYSVSDTITDTGGAGSYVTTYTLQITKDNAVSDGLILVGIQNEVNQVKATLATSGFAIPSQMFTAGYPINGSGNVLGNILTLSYAHYMSTCKAKGTRI